MSKATTTFLTKILGFKGGYSLSGKRKERTDKLWVWISSGGVGVFHDVPRNPGNINFLVEYPGSCTFSQEPKKPININNFAGLSRNWVGVKLFMCFPFSWGKRETHTQTSLEISGKGRDNPGAGENFVYVFSVCWFSRPYFLVGISRGCPGSSRIECLCSTFGPYPMAGR